MTWQASGLDARAGDQHRVGFEWRARQVRRQRAGDLTSAPRTPRCPRRSARRGRTKRLRSNSMNAGCASAGPTIWTARPTARAGPRAAAERRQFRKNRRRAGAFEHLADGRDGEHSRTPSNDGLPHRRPEHRPSAVGRFFRPLSHKRCVRILRLAPTVMPKFDKRLKPGPRSIRRDLRLRHGGGGSTAREERLPGNGDQKFSEYLGSS
jgi:hypothetical protein